MPSWLSAERFESIFDSDCLNLHCCYVILPYTNKLCGSIILPALIKYMYIVRLLRMPDFRRVGIIPCQSIDYGNGTL